MYDTHVPVHPRGAGASQGPMPDGYEMVSRWADKNEAELWMRNQGTTVPADIGAGNRVYVTEYDGPKPSGVKGDFRIDFGIDGRALNAAGQADWRQIHQPVQTRPIYNVTIWVPKGYVPK